ncbi:DNA cytosine methyltransferase [Cereibacter azotoformans]|uniref:Cytosine-specific methyltransferase n=1 Tax=Cereibacter azotoformans TaxID=43057 RepID=A0A2T5K737_9RHOB|nr:DNA cytosine methyltransferase [Cereibacter azotoformans]MBO4169522.1 DNA cytosine methyltransferase [Cereibacter azotoformans]PTR18199.1 DNA (cytosine-5)-methyltransferase 1 [Cereibacter azotoformans]
MLTILDLFSGAGGLSLGFHAAGYKTVAAVEVAPDACATYRAAFPDVEMLEKDIKTIDFTKYSGDVDVVIGGPPCQPFSTGGKRMGAKDLRDMLPEFVRVVLQVRPKAFLMENVAGLAGARHAPYLREVFQPLFNLYDIEGPRLVNAADYGVPQKRKRILMTGIRKGEGGEFCLPDAGEHVPVSEVVGPNAIGTPNRSKVVYAKTPDLRPSPYDGQMFNGGGRPLNMNAPAHTILASCGGNKTPFIDIGTHVPGYHQHLMKGGKPRVGDLPDARRLTPEECAAIQTFPADHPFQGARSSIYTQVGNAVPPKLAHVAAVAMAEALGC